MRGHNCYNKNPLETCFSSDKNLEYHVDRISVGVQSFMPDERKRLGRPGDSQESTQALEAIRNADLIYGIQDQTKTSWQQTLQRTVAFEPEEIYLYPLYVRKGTCLGSRGFDWPDRMKGKER